MTQLTSRFITHPDTVCSDTRHAVVIIDADVDDLENIGLFCKVSNLNYDVYLYRNDLNDLQWLAAITKLSDYVLVNTTSTITIPQSSSSSKFGLGEQLTDALAYFQNKDTQLIK